MAIAAILAVLFIGGGIGMNYSCDIMEQKIDANVCYKGNEHQKGAEMREYVKKLKSRGTGYDG